MKLNKSLILLGVVVVAGLAFIMSFEKAPEKVVGVTDDKKMKVGFVYLTTPCLLYTSPSPRDTG